MTLRSTLALGGLLLAGCPAADDGGGQLADTGSGSGTAAESEDDAGATSTQGDTTTTSGGVDGSTGADSGSDGASTGTTADSGDSSDGGSDDTTTGRALCTARPIAGLDSAIAILVGDIPPPKGGGMTTTADGGGEGGEGGGVPDDSLRIELANVSLTCADPYIDYECAPQEKWNLTITLPVEMQAPGVYDLNDLIAGYTFIGAGAGEDCPSGGGGGLGGTLTIDAIGPDGVIGCLETDDIFDFDGNGSFAAEMCGM